MTTVQLKCMKTLQRTVHYNHSTSYTPASHGGAQITAPQHLHLTASTRAFFSLPFFFFSSSHTQLAFKALSRKGKYLSSPFLGLGPRGSTLVCRFVKNTLAPHKVGDLDPAEGSVANPQWVCVCVCVCMHACMQVCMHGLVSDYEKRHITYTSRFILRQPL